MVEGVGGGDGLKKAVGGIKKVGKKTSRQSGIARRKPTGSAKPKVPKISDPYPKPSPRKTLAKKDAPLGGKKDGGKSLSSKKQRPPKTKIGKVLSGAKKVGQAGERIKSGAKSLKPSELKNTAKKVARKVKAKAKAAIKKLAKEGIKKLARMCFSNPYCAGAVVLALLVATGFIFGILLLSSTADEELRNLGGSDGAVNASSSGGGGGAGAGAVGSAGGGSTMAVFDDGSSVRVWVDGDVVNAKDVIGWSEVGELLGDDGLFVVDGDVERETLLAWISAGGSERGEIRSLSDSPCDQSTELADDLRGQWRDKEGIDESDDDFSHWADDGFLLPAWGPGIEAWSISVGITSSPPAPASGGGSGEDLWERVRFGECHETKVLLTLLARLAEWESLDDADEREDFIGETNLQVLNAYERTIGEEQPGFTRAGYRALLMWMLYERWQHVFATPAEKQSPGAPFGIRLCNLGGDMNKHLDWLLDKASDFEGEVVIFNPCPPPVSVSVCDGYAEIESALTGQPISAPVDGTPRSEARPEPETGPISLRACDLLIEQSVVSYLCGGGGPCDSEAWTEEEQAEAAAEAARRRQEILDALQAEMLATLEDRPTPRPGPLLSPVASMQMAATVIAASLEAPGSDHYTDKSLRRTLAETLWHFRCVESQHVICEEELSGDDSLDDVFVGTSANATMEWRMGWPVQSARGSAMILTEEGDWIVTLADTGEQIRVPPVECPWLLRYTFSWGSSGDCAIVTGDRLETVLGLFGYSPGSDDLWAWLSADCPEIVPGQPLKDTLGVSAVIDDVNDPRLVQLPTEYTHNGTKIHVHACLYEPLVMILQWSYMQFETQGETKEPASLKILSGWRSVAKQEQLREYYGCDTLPQCTNPTTGEYHPVAPPGTSMHHTGLAVDFLNCSTVSSDCWGWLSDVIPYAGNVLRNLKDDQGNVIEAWHWSTNGR